MINAKCRQCRRAGEKLFLKGERCLTPKCAMVKKAYPPGRQGKSKKGGSRTGASEYGRQMREKQRLKKIYGILERQFKKYFRQALAQKGDTRENLLRQLEMRLDNTIFRLGWAKSRAAARQLVGHGHVLVNNRRVNLPSYRLRIGEVIALKEKTKKLKLMENLTTSLKKYEPPKWLLLDKERIEARILSGPSGEDLGDLVPIGLIVEFYSR